MSKVLHWCFSCSHVGQARQATAGVGGAAALLVLSSDRIHLRIEIYIYTYVVIYIDICIDLHIHNYIYSYLCMYSCSIQKGACIRIGIDTTLLEIQDQPPPSHPPDAAWHSPESAIALPLAVHTVAIFLKFCAATSRAYPFPLAVFHSLP